MSFRPTSYTLRCLACGKEYTQDDHRLACDADHGPAFVRARYQARQLTVKEEAEGMFRFGDWLPLRRPIRNTGYPVAYKSEGLASKLGLSNLWVVFSGYWPERGADMRTCTFKELEAPPVLSRFRDDSRTIVVASAGNTARAFAEVCSANDIPLLLVVPEIGLKNLWSTGEFSDAVRLVVVTGGADYFDAIRLAGMIAALPSYVPEGGAKNVARRDGMGTSVLAAVTTAGRIPDHYFQAVGSGTGGIAAWEEAASCAEPSLRPDDRGLGAGAAHTSGDGRGRGAPQDRPDSGSRSVQPQTSLLSSGRGVRRAYRHRRRHVRRDQRGGVGGRRGVLRKRGDRPHTRGCGGDRGLEEGP